MACAPCCHACYRYSNVVLTSADNTILLCAHQVGGYGAQQHPQQLGRSGWSLRTHTRRHSPEQQLVHHTHMAHSWHTPGTLMAHTHGRYITHTWHTRGTRMARTWSKGIHETPPLPPPPLPPRWAARCLACGSCKLAAHTAYRHRFRACHHTQ